MEDSKQKELATEIPQEIEEMQPLLQITPHMDQQMEDHDVINIDIKAMIRDTQDDLLLPSCCIYRVPPMIRNVNEDAYTPRVVSVGPFHYGNERLQEMERYKQILFKKFTQIAATSLDDLINFAKQSEPTVRASYSENITASKKEFVKLILVDACFIIEIFMRFYANDEISNDAILSQTWLTNYMVNDLLLLENQLPFFFLEDLFNKAFPLDLRGDLPSFLKLSYKFFEEVNIQNLKPNANVQIKNFTDLLRLFILQGKEPPRDSSLGARAINVLLYTTSELQEAGVKLEASTSNCLLDLKFSGHVLEIPQIFLGSHTEVFLRNIIALEQCHYPYKCYITDYAVLLGWLVNTDKDVDVLVRKNIIQSVLNDSNEITRAINGLCTNCVQMNFNSEYLDMCRRLNRFYQDPWHKRKATLKHDYLKTPWQTVASIAGIILLILTLIQTITSILQVVFKK